MQLKIFAKIIVLIGMFLFVVFKQTFPNHFKLKLISFFYYCMSLWGQGDAALMPMWLFKLLKIILVCLLDIFRWDTKYILT